MTLLHAAMGLIDGRIESIDDAAAVLTGNVDEAAAALLDQSPLLPSLEASLRSTEIDMDTYPAFYLAIQRVIRMLWANSELQRLLDSLPGQYESLHSLVSSQADVAQLVLNDTDAEKSSEKLYLMKYIVQTNALVAEAVSNRQKSEAKEETDVNEKDMEAIYQKTLKKMLVGSRHMSDASGNYVGFKYSSRITAEPGGKERLSRVGAELRAMRSSLPLNFGSSCFMR